MLIPRTLTHDSKMSAWFARQISVLLFSCLVVSVGYGGTFYVSNSGSPACSNTSTNGSQASPWCTITYGLGQIRSGDTLYVKAGSYTEDIYINGPAGTASNPTVIQAYPGQTVNIIGSGINSGRVKITSTSYLTFDGFNISNFNQGIMVENSNHLTLSHCAVSSVGQEGIHIRYNSSFVTVSQCTVHDTGTWAYDGEGIYIGSSTSESTVDNTNNVVVTGTTVYNTTNEGVELKPGTHDCIIDGNTFHNTNSASNGYGGAAIEVNQAVASPQHWDSNPNHIIRNNIVYANGPGTGAANLNSGIRAGTGGLYYNNVIYSVNSLGYGIFTDNQAGDSYSRGIYHNTIAVPSARAFVNSGGPADVRNNIGPASTNNLPVAATYFSNYSGNNYHLVAGGAPVNAGVNVTAIVPTDIEGVSRTANGASDIGAYELVATVDGIPPSVPASLSASGTSSSSVSLTWAASTDNLGVTGYNIYRGGTQIGTSTGTSYTDSGLAPSTRYTYTVAAYDAAANVSGQSSQAQATTLAVAGNQITASSCSQTAVQTAINAATAGSTVLVPAGTCTWTTASSGTPSVILNKAITLQGQTTCSGAGANLSCSDATIIYDGTGTAFLEIPLEISASDARVTGFTFLDTRSVSDAKSAVQTDRNTTGWRIDHCHFHPTNTNNTRAISAWGFGLIDHIVFEQAQDGVDVEGGRIGDSVDGDGSWSQPMGFGTANAIYIEDNRFIYSSPLDGAFDSYAGARVVFRYNYVSGTNIGGHGLDSGGSRSTLWADINNNTFVNPNSSIYTMGNTRGGSWLLWNNTVSATGGSYNSFWWIQNYRSDSNYSTSWGACDGTNPIDQNISGMQGWGCKDQVGRGTNQGVYPQYSWGNSFKGAPATVASNFNVCGYSDCTRARTYHLNENREFFNEVSSFTGAVGVGVGVGSARPSSCAAGVGYFATDQGTLYQCTSPGVWSAYYTSFQYPHPLQAQVLSSMAPPTPIGLTSSVR
jgi:chitodextrinase